MGDYGEPHTVRSVKSIWHEMGLRTRQRVINPTSEMQDATNYLEQSDYTPTPGVRVSSALESCDTDTVLVILQLQTSNEVVDEKLRALSNKKMRAEICAWA